MRKGEGEPGDKVCVPGPLFGPGDEARNGCTVQARDLTTMLCNQSRASLTPRARPRILAIGPIASSAETRFKF